MTVLQASDVVRDCLRGGWKSELRRPPLGPPFWLITSTDGETRTLMGLHRLTEAQIRNRVKGLQTRMYGKQRHRSP